MILKTDYTDRIVSGSKKYEFINNGDGTYCIEDRTVYSVEGDYYGAADINKQNYVCNSLVTTYENVDDIIAYLRSIGATLPDNSVSSIIDAINSLATNAYNNGRATGRTQVINNPNQYNLYSSQQYNAVDDSVDDYQDRISYVSRSLTALKNLMIPDYNAEMVNSKETVKDTIDYAVANMSADRTKNVRAAIKSQFRNERTVCYNALNSVCSVIDDCLRKLSI